MTYQDAVDVGMDIFSEFFPKNVTKAVKLEALQALFAELEDQGALSLEDDDDEEEDDEDDTKPLDF